MSTENTKKPNRLTYAFARCVSNVFSKVIFKKKIIRNEIKNVKGSFVVIANHQSQLDFVNLIGATKRRLTFVISNSFYNTLPIKGLLNSLSVIPKQQFQTEYNDIKKMKSVIDSGNPLVIYPAGLMTENGVSTPIPPATNKFLKFMNTDIYVAKTYGTYFCMPKWSKKIRRGKTYIDIYKLISKEDLQKASNEEISKILDDSLFFDAYLEQEKLKIKYKNNDDVNGLENVLYQCPNCGTEFSINVKDKNTLYCSHCGFSEKVDALGFLHNEDKEKEIRYVPEWDYIIYNKVKKEILENDDFSLSDETTIQMIDYKKRKFVDVGSGKITLDMKGFTINGNVNNQDICLNVNMRMIPSLPFKPGKFIEIQHGKDIYRCLLKNGKLAMKFIHCIQAFYEINNNIEIKKYNKNYEFVYQQLFVEKK